ncbi:hypothetical protein [Actinokineospora globicatena]|uniref:hypothetical protein n=1 Tax=Actinokineospora globicatena TaxID=103729 RepID=UPI0020A2E54E|nr:hypothetical protein [Actinokineospora globicatena]MCP2301005.1 hypothetical protein [Actinokineospora globicatena]GLW77362.1 hypothetical protein Aglo01_18440 [Actinokineospora globicatena]GLW84196.1 hypothetical protein Aglo02_18360 [Actinokineospora globicatena]
MSEQPWAENHPVRPDQQQHAVGQAPVGGYVLHIPPRRRKPWIWVVLGVVLVVLAGAFTWLAIDTAPGAAPSKRGEEVRTKVISAPDGSGRFTTPVDWTEMPGEYQAEGASMTYGQIYQERYLMLFAEEKSEFDDFADYEESAIMLMANLPSESTRVGDREPVRIGKLSGARYEVTGVFDGEPCVFWFTVIEGQRRYYQVMTWTLASRRDSAEPALAEVVATFEE